jgi:hypothetical protein
MMIGHGRRIVRGKKLAIVWRIIISGVIGWAKGITKY